MTWQKHLYDWEKDKIQPMVHPKTDIEYAYQAIDRGRRFVKHLKLDLEGERVLDVTVGSGGILCAFAEVGSKCYGLDIFDYFLNMTKQRFMDMDLEYEFINKWKGINIPYPDGFFDF